MFDAGSDDGTFVPTVGSLLRAPMISYLHSLRLSTPPAR